MVAKFQTTKERLLVKIVVKLNSFCSSKTAINKVKKAQKVKIFAIHVLNTELVSRIYKELFSKTQ